IYQLVLILFFFFLNKLVLVPQSCSQLGPQPHECPLATFLRQWARQYLHALAVRQDHPPHIRAHTSIREYFT
ncbi:hypothetical protein EDB86DRAFT_2965423, partial [Lactarius hatsudake]